MSPATLRFFPSSTNGHFVRRNPPVNRTTRHSTAANFAELPWRPLSEAASPTKEMEPRMRTDEHGLGKRKNDGKLDTDEIDRKQTRIPAGLLYCFYPRLSGKSVVPIFLLVGAGFGGGMHAVLGGFVDAARRRFLVNAVKMIERAGAFADGKTFFDLFRHVGFGEQHGLAQRATAGKLRGNGGGECASRAVRVFAFEVIAAETQHFRSIEENVDGFFHVAALDDHGERATLDNLARRGFHRSMILDGNAGKNFGFGDIRSDH